MKQKGMTLLEVLLVLAIISSLLLFAARQYQQYRNEAFAISLRYNVNSILEALGYYYQANCDHGTLAPAARGGTMVAQPVKPISITTDLSGYFPANLKFTNPLVDNNAGPDKGYFAQYNYFQTTPGRNSYVCYSYWSTTPGGPAGCSYTNAPINNTIIIGWQIQVAVKMLNPLTTPSYLALSGADCAVDVVPTNQPVDCGAMTPGPHQFLVWQRMPSFASSEINSNLWLSMPGVKTFNLQYTNDPLLEMNVSGTPYYYLCGG